MNAIKCYTFAVAGLLLTSQSSAERPQSAREQTLENLVRAQADRLSVLEKRVAELEQRLQGGSPMPTKPTTAIASGGKAPLEVFWQNGLRMESSDKAFKLRLGGRIQNDWAFFAGEDDIGGAEDGTRFRRARFFTSGLLYERFEFKAEYDFVGGDADFQDVYMGVRNLPWIGNLRLGHIKEPIGLERLTGGNDTTFMERALNDTFTPNRNIGFLAHRPFLDGRVTGALGVFHDSDNFGTGTGDGDYSITGRITALPWFEDGGRNLWHVDAGYSHRSPADGRIRYRARPESFLAPRLVDTGSMATDGVDLINFGTALVTGSLSLQGEYSKSLVESSASDRDFGGYYVQGSYILTGEHRRYKKGAGSFGSVNPERNFLGPDGGPGAWEVAVRYSAVDLNDADISGGSLDDYTFGLSWYLNPNLKAMFNYIYTDVDPADASIFQFRFQIHF